MLEDEKKGRNISEQEFEKELVKLNIVMSYPVKWSEHTVLSNFVQNFYDALGPSNFGQKFRYAFSERTLTMSAEEGFAREWLYYIGATTKRGGDFKYAGGFGEGFKIAALVSLRDFSLGIYMESRDWTLTVTSVTGEIDGHPTEFLSYQIGKRQYSRQSNLCIFNVPESFRPTMNEVMKCYFYEGNSLFGACLAKTDEYAIFITNPDPPTKRASGYVFASYELRGRIAVPLVICNHSYKPDNDDRDRTRFDDWQISKCVEKVFRQLDPRTSLNVLEHLRKVWSGRDWNRYHSLDWNPLIRILLDNILSDPVSVSVFQEKYLQELVIRDTKAEEPNPDKRRMAMAWLQTSSVRSRVHFVPKYFLPLGVRTVCMLCEEMDGYTTEREPDEFEQKRIAVLREAARFILGDLLLLDQWPKCRILLNPKAPVQGYTRVKKTNGRINPYGLRVTATADYIYLQWWLFRHTGFPDAFVTYAHELLHQYGGDTTLSFHRALSLMNQKILVNLHQFRKYEKIWDGITFC